MVAKRLLQNIMHCVGGTGGVNLSSKRTRRFGSIGKKFYNLAVLVPFQRPLRRTLGGKVVVNAVCTFWRHSEKKRGHLRPQEKSIPLDILSQTKMVQKGWVTNGVIEKYGEIVTNGTKKVR